MKQGDHLGPKTDCVKFNTSITQPQIQLIKSYIAYHIIIICILVVVLSLYQRHLLVNKNIDILRYLTHQVHYIWNEYYDFIYLISAERCFFYNYTTFIKKIKCSFFNCNHSLLKFFSKSVCIFFNSYLNQ